MRKRKYLKHYNSPNGFSNFNGFSTNLTKPNKGIAIHINRNDGIVSYSYNVAPRQTGDNSNYFATGTKTVSNTPIKFFQFGVESGDPLTSTWFAKEYDLTYQETNSYNTQTTATTDDNNNQQTGSWITYVNNIAYPVGLSTYTQANAHSNT